MNPKFLAAQVTLGVCALTGAVAGVTWVWATALVVLVAYTFWAVIG